jgi:hypothetical protein
MKEETKKHFETDLTLFLTCDDCHIGIKEANWLFYIDFQAGGNRVICRNCFFKNQFPMKSLTLLWLFEYDNTQKLQSFEFFDTDRIKTKIFGEIQKEIQSQMELINQKLSTLAK